MIEVGRFVDGLKVTGVELFAGVPDSLLKSFCAYDRHLCCEKSYSTTSTPPMGSDPLSSIVMVF